MGVLGDLSVSEVRFVESSSITAEPAIGAANRTLVIIFTPTSETLPSTAPKGTVVATFTAHWSTGRAYPGPFAFGGSHGDYGGIFEIVGEKVVISPTGPGITSLVDQTVYIKIIR